MAYDESTKAQCVALGNYLVTELSLVDIPRYRSINEIHVSHLLMIHCRLLDLSMDDFIASDRPWENVEKMILSLRDRFGADHFLHLDSMLIAVGEPTMLLFLLQIYQAILNYNKRHGLRYDNVDDLNQTILTDSRASRNSPGPPPSSPATRSDLDFDLEILQNTTGNEDVVVRHVEGETDRHKIQVLIPKLLEPSRKVKPKRIFNDDVGVHSPESQGRSPMTNQPMDISQRSKSKPAERISVKQKPGTSRSFKPRSKERVNAVPTLPVDQQDAPGPSSRTTDQKLPCPPGKHRRSEKTKSKKPTIPPVLQDEDLGEDEEIDRLEEENNDLQQAYDHLQQQLLCDLLEMDAEVKSLRDRNHRKGLQSCVTAKYDYFGRPIRERFPYYPYGLIRLRCHSPDVKRKAKTRALDKENTGC